MIPRLGNPRIRVDVIEFLEEEFARNPDGIDAAPHTVHVIHSRGISRHLLTARLAGTSFPVPVAIDVSRGYLVLEGMRETTRNKFPHCNRVVVPDVPQ